MRIFPSVRQLKWIDRLFAWRKGPVKLGVVDIQAPFRHIAMHVMQTPSVRLFLSDRLRLVQRRFDVPSVITERRGIVAKTIGRFGARTARILPFGFGR